MNNELKDNLEEYLGQLTYDWENFECGFLDDKYGTLTKIKAVRTLLALKEEELPTTFYSTCCGAEVMMIEIDICPLCLEHCDFEEL